MRNRGKSNMAQFVRTMKLNRVTNGAVRFGEDLSTGEPEVLGNIYLKKWALGEKVAGIKKGDYEDSDVTIKVTVDV